jgi:hypothetical protein
MTTNADNFRQRVADHAWERGATAIEFATRLGAAQLSDRPCEAWGGEGEGFPWRFRDGSLAVIRSDGHEVAVQNRHFSLRVATQYAAEIAAA